MKMTLEIFGKTVNHAPDLIAGYYSALFGVNEKIDSLYFKEGKTEEEKAELETQEKLQKYLIKKINKTFKVMKALPMFTAMLGEFNTIVFYMKFVDSEKYGVSNQSEGFNEKSINEAVLAIRKNYEFFYETYLRKSSKSNEK